MFPVNYDSCNWKMLSQYLQGPDREKIPVLTRAKLLHDSWNLAYSAELCFGIALNMTLFLKEERSHVVWEPVFMMIDHIGRRIEGSDVYPKFEVNIFYLRTTSNILILGFYTALYLILIRICLFFKNHKFNLKNFPIKRYANIVCYDLSFFIKFLRLLCEANYYKNLNIAKTYEAVRFIIILGIYTHFIEASVRRT